MEMVATEKGTSFEVFIFCQKKLVVQLKAPEQNPCEGVLEAL